MTYNHEKYIHKCLDGFVMQKTNFPYEILVHEDASTDNTARIAKEYEIKYSKLFRCVYQTENQFAKQNTLVNILFPMSRGKYIAFCEGDDYWTDPDKLQKQVDFLEENPEYSICFHDVMILKNGQIVKDYLTRIVPEETEILELAKGNFIHTPSVVFRNKLFKHFPEQFSRAPVGDYFLHMLNARYGKIKKINQAMAVYRLHDAGIHSNKTQAQKDDEWITQLSLMIPCFEGETKSILINKFLQFAKSVLLNNKNISFERQSLILSQISEFSPGFLIRRIEENEELKVQLNSIKNYKWDIIRLLKKIFSK
jgi:glycosyltransferase involved in cell wall biosynthesis